jgi:hypothetical protein
VRGSDAHAPDPAEPTLGTLSVPVSPSPTVSSLTILVGHGVCLSRALAWVVGARERAGPAVGSRVPLPAGLALGPDGARRCAPDSAHSLILRLAL